MREQATPPVSPEPRTAFLDGGGEMGRRIRLHDWVATLGPVDSWPLVLRGVLGICLQSSFPTAVYWGPELRLLYNDAWSPIPGDKHPWALGRPAREVWPDIWHVIEPQLRDVLEHGRGFSTFDQMLPMTRGGRVEETYWNYSLTPIRDEAGCVVGIFNQGNETTEQVFAARHREAEIDRWRELFRQAPSGVAVLRGPQHVFELANPAYLELVGHRPVLGLPVADALPEVVRQGFVRILDDVFTNGQAFTGHGVKLMLRPAFSAVAEERIVDFVYQPIKSPSGRTTGIFVQVTDVTARARTEEALRRTEAELREADRRKDEFLATLAHELRNPLAPLLSATGVIQLAAKDPMLSKASGIIVRQVHHMVHLVDDLLDVSRITRGRIHLRLRPVELETIVNHAVESAQPLIDAQHHELFVELPEQPISIHADPVRLSQALSNLVNNAARYTPEGGRIEIRALALDDHVELHVVDNGSGIRPEALESIFELFTQGDSASERSLGGLGIGLHLARQLVELHGGTVTAHSEGLGAGSKFVISLPRAAQTGREESDRSVGDR